jgi:hypothetical protein
MATVANRAEVDMSAESRRSLDETARLGTEMLSRHVLPGLGPEENGKFVALDVESGDYELDEDDYTAVSRLRSRRPTAEVWLACVGQPAAYLIRRLR